MLIHSDFKISLSGWHWALELTVSATLLKLYSPWKEVKLGALSPRMASFSEVRSVPSGCAISLATAPVTMGGAAGVERRRFGTGDLASNPISPAGQLCELEKVTDV